RERRQPGGAGGAGSRPRPRGARLRLPLGGYGDRHGADRRRPALHRLDRGGGRDRLPASRRRRPVAAPPLGGPGGGGGRRRAGADGERAGHAPAPDRPQGIHRGAPGGRHRPQGDRGGGVASIGLLAVVSVLAAACGTTSSNTGTPLRGGTLTIDNESGTLWNCGFNPFNGNVSFLAFGPVYEPLVYDNLLNDRKVPMLA